MKKTVSLILALLLVVCLSACGKAAHAGTYKLVSVGNETIQYDNENSALEGLVNAAYELVLNKDGTGTMSILGFGTKFTWDTKSITIGGTKLKVKFKGDTMTIYGDDDADTMVYKKQK